MRPLQRLLILALGLLAAPSVRAEQGTFSDGRDWTTKMTRGEKLMAVAAPMIFLHEYGVPIRLTPDFYVPFIDRLIVDNPQLENEDVANIFASSVYFVEPDTRPILRSLESKFLRGEYDLELDPDLRYMTEVE